MEGEIHVPQMWLILANAMFPSVRVLQLGQVAPIYVGVARDARVCGAHGVHTMQYTVAI